jgi:hypothetical protein
VDHPLLEFCDTEKQKQVIKLCMVQGKSQYEAADILGLSRGAIKHHVKAVRQKAAKRGYSPDHDMNKPVPDGFVVSGVSTYYNDDGVATGQWVKSKLTEENRLKALNEAIKEAVSDYEGKAKPTKLNKRKAHADDVLVAIPIGDPHIGMYAWSEETGENFDTQIARDDLLNASRKLLDATPHAEKALICNLGDFFHADNQSNQTSRSKHALDVDSRWARVLKLGCMIMVDMIHLALKKYPQVEVINAIGNHDDHSSVMLSAFLAAYFTKEPRVEIHPTVSKFNYVQFGKCLIGVTHGDTVKHADLGELMATDKAEEWGATEHRMWFVGHIHHSRKTELRGCTVESFRTLAAKDAWHASKGYRSGRDITALVLHKDFGEVARYRCDIRMARWGNSE